MHYASVPRLQAGAGERPSIFLFNHSVNSVDAPGQARGRIRNAFSQKKGRGGGNPLNFFQDLSEGYRAASPYHYYCSYQSFNDCHRDAEKRI